MKIFLIIEDEDYSKSRTKIGLSVDKKPQQTCKSIAAIVDVVYCGCKEIANILEC